MKFFIVFLWCIVFCRALNIRTTSLSSGLATLTSPLTMGILTPLLGGVARGIYDAGQGTEHTADLLGGAVQALTHTVGGVASNTLIGAGIATAEIPNVAQYTIKAIQNNDGPVGEFVQLTFGQ